MIRLRSRSRTLVAVATLVLLVLLGGSAAAAPSVSPGCQPPLLGPDRYSFWLNVCGPGRVIRNTQHTYEVVLKNFGRRNFRTVKLSVIHWEPISRSSIPSRRAIVRFGTARERAAIWTLHNFKPGRLFRVNITLPFKQHNDPKGSNLFVFARGLDPSVGRPEIQEATKDITFVR